MTTITQAEGVRICAEKDGFVLLHEGTYLYDETLIPYRIFERGGKQVGGDKLPDYPNSYDALLPLIQKQDKATKAKVAELVGWNFDATPQQLFTALLAAWGYKVEEK